MRTKTNSPFGVIFSIIFFFVFAPKLLRFAYGEGYKYTNSKHGSGFYRLTQKDDLGYYKGKYRATYTIGIIATLILAGLVSAIIILSIVMPVQWRELGFFDWVQVGISGFVAVFLCFMVVFLWAYIRGQVTGLREKVAAANEKLRKGIQIDQWGNEVKPKTL